MTSIDEDAADLIGLPLQNQPNCFSGYIMHMYMYILIIEKNKNQMNEKCSFQTGITFDSTTSMSVGTRAEKIQIIID